MKRTTEPEPLPPAPAGLSERSQRLWDAIVRKRARSPGRLALLEAALRSLDRSDQAAAEVTKGGLVSVTESTGAAHLHPAAKAEKDFRGQFIAAWSQLGLSFDGVIDGRI